MFSPSTINRPDLLLTGFEPFRQFLINPSWIAAERVAGEFPGRVVARCLPVDHLRSREAILRILPELQPRGILLMGLAAGDVFRIERIARKVNEFEMLGGELECAGSMDMTTLADALTRVSAPWRYSDDAGRYVCESTYWSVIDYLNANRQALPCGFLHVPAVSDAWPAERTVDVVREVVRDLLANQP